jgi:hypothetical protein
MGNVSKGKNPSTCTNYFLLVLIYRVTVTGMNIHERVNIL